MKTMANMELKLKNSLDSQSFLTRLGEWGIKNPFPWLVVSSLELADMLGVHLQTIANWQIRKQGPQSEPKGHWRGNRRYFSIASIMAWLEDKEPWEIYQEWIGRKFKNALDMSKGECEKLIDYLIKTGVYKQPKWKRKRRSYIPDFSFNGAVK
ncbi:MAG: hypothetical protein COA85_06905 [Robiginitomaculum sp.]|nr:MAG: hypothetical protein COA85_06905 [Robiginitomaculum sp.]